MKILVLYSTLTMNTEAVAEKIVELVESKDQSHEVEMINAIDIFDPSEFEKYDLIIFGVSTWNDGELPPDGIEFLEMLRSQNTKFKGLKFAYFGLGDSAYGEYYNKAIIDMREIFEEEFGAESIGETFMIDGYPDDEIYQEVEEWLGELLKNN